MDSNRAMSWFARPGGGRSLSRPGSVDERACPEAIPAVRPTVLLWWETPDTGRDDSSVRSVILLRRSLESPRGDVERPRPRAEGIDKNDGEPG